MYNITEKFKYEYLIKFHCDANTDNVVNFEIDKIGYVFTQ